MILHILLSILAITLSILFSPVYGEINCPSGNKIDLDNKKEVKKLLSQSVFQVVIVSYGPPRKEETIGTATLVSDEGYLLTAEHIFESDQQRILKGLASNKLKLQLRIPANETENFVYNGHVKKLSEKFDLAIIRLSDWDWNRRYLPIGLDVKSNPIDDEARLMGYIVNKRFPTISEKGNLIRESSADGYLRATNLSAYQGYSGGLLISSDGMGVAVLSGKFVKDNDDNITWAEIGDRENNALNAAPLIAVINELSNLSLGKTDNFIERLNSSNKTIPDYEINDLLKFNRLAAIALASRLMSADEIKKLKLTNKENQWHMFSLVECLMPRNITKEIFFKLRQASSSEDQKKWFSSEVVKFALKAARESKDLKYSLGMYDLAFSAIDSTEFDEAYMNYAYLDYYKALLNANHEGIALINVDSPSEVIGESIIKISKNMLDYSSMSKPISASRSLLFSAATAELNKKGKYYDGTITAAAALKTAYKVNDTLVKDWYFMNSKAINTEKDQGLLNSLIIERGAVNWQDPSDTTDSSKFTVNLDEISTPSSTQLLKSVVELK